MPEPTSIEASTEARIERRVRRAFQRRHPRAKLAPIVDIEDLESGNALVEVRHPMTGVLIERYWFVQDGEDSNGLHRVTRVEVTEQGHSLHTEPEPPTTEDLAEELDALRGRMLRLERHLGTRWGDA